MINKRTVLYPVLTLLWTAIIASTPAQEVSIPDSELNDAIRQTLQKPTGPLTEQDLLNLTILNACCRNVRNLQGLEGARNLRQLALDHNLLTDFSIAGQWTNLVQLDLSFNSLTNISVPDNLTNLATLLIQANRLTNLHLPDGMRALVTLDLDDNQLAHFTVPTGLKQLISLNLAENQLTSLTLPAGMTNLDGLFLFSNQLTNLSLPADMTKLASLDLRGNRLAHLTLPAAMTNLVSLDLGQNLLTDLILPAELTKLNGLSIEENLLPSLALPPSLTNLVTIDLEHNRLTRLDLPANLTHLDLLSVIRNQLTNFTLPTGLTALTELDAWDNQLTSLTLPADMTNLLSLQLFFNQLTNLTLPVNLRTLSVLDLEGNRFTSFNVPSTLTGLTLINLRANQLTNFSLPAGLTNLNFLTLAENQLTSLTFRAGLSKLAFLELSENQLTSFTLPPDIQQLDSFFVVGNPFTTLVLSETLASTKLAAEVAALRNQGVSVFTYPLAVRLGSPQRTLDGAFEFTLTGPPGLYAVLGSTNLAAWSVLGTATNTLGRAVFQDGQANLSPQKFYRGLLQSPPTNMVFIPPSTFLMGSPASELDRNTDEGPQTTVTLSRGFWIGKYEVTQGEYLAVMNTNPSVFLGDLSRPVSSVSWPDATNYCAKLTERELAAGRVPSGSRYRLPTEAEWECAARAGTSTRFSYGDDLAYASLPNHAWYASNSGITPHPVGQKLPNPWGLYDMEGNVGEWCQDWFDLLPGGVQTDPTGPVSSASGRKVMRGGAYDNSQQSCRSAERSLFPAGAFLTDSDLGFRVVLVMEPQ
ncbi:MAG TPA: SUMF1/EgtB/PvdO family nonheme iron enzyme [Verrucomicrobiae bacterium]|nr:SUMF1/EgtB/PvdO family nonheme iron enzyme [Verrucomicrobiae bacterium]